MKNFENLKALKETLGKVQAVIPELQSKIDTGINAQAELDSEAIKAEAIESKDAARKEKAARENKENIRRLTDELEHAKKRVEIIEIEARKLEDAATAEIREAYREPYEQALREFYKSAQIAAAAERKYLSIMREAEEKINAVSSRGRIIFSPPLILFEDHCDPEFWPLARFAKQAKVEGINLD